MRNLWLIDAGYLIKASRSIAPGWRFDYARLRGAVHRRVGEVGRALFLNSIREGRVTPAEEGFNAWLQSPWPGGPGLEVELYPLKQAPLRRAYCLDCGMKVSVGCTVSGEHRLAVEQQKRVDVALAVRAMALMPEFDRLVLSSGDGDLLPALEQALGGGKSLHLVVMRHGVSRELRERAEEVHWIDAFRHEVEAGRL